MDLNDYKKRNSLTTPDGYFEKLNDEIKRATCMAQPVARPRRSTASHFAGLLGYAATIAVVALIAAHIITDTQRERANAEMAVFDSLDDSDFVDNMLASYPIDEYTFYSYMTGIE